MVLAGITYEHETSVAKKASNVSSSSVCTSILESLLLLGWPIYLLLSWCIGLIYITCTSCFLQNIHANRLLNEKRELFCNVVKLSVSILSWCWINSYKNMIKSIVAFITGKYIPL